MIYNANLDEGRSLFLVHIHCIFVKIYASILVSKRFFSAKSLNVFELSLDKWEYPKHSHNFFELIFILKGNGQHILNESVFEYAEGDIFLLTPKDEHEFIISDHTDFGFIKFTEQLFIEKTELVSDLKWRKNIDAIVLHANSIPENIISNTTDRSHVFELFRIIKKEYQTPSLYSRSILLELLGALLIIISRNLNKNVAIPTISEEEKVSDVLTYIRQNVLDKDAIRIKKIAATFNMSPSYVSVFIKKHAGISIQQYVIQTKIKMAERLLKQTNLNISEIAQKTGFTDSSHFNKLFKKYTGKNPSDF